MYFQLFYTGSCFRHKRSQIQVETAVSRLMLSAYGHVQGDWIATWCLKGKSWELLIKSPSSCECLYVHKGFWFSPSPVCQFLCLLSILQFSFLRNHCPGQCCEAFVYVFLYFIILILKYGFHHLELIFIYGVREGIKFIFLSTLC